MRELQNHHLQQQQQRRQQPLSYKRTKLLSKLLNSPSACVVLLLLVYILGYLSAFRQPPSPPVSPPSTKQQEPFSAVTTTQLANVLPTQVDNFRVTTHCADRLPSPELVRQKVLDQVFNSTSPFLNFPPPHVAPLLRAKTVKGWGSYGAVFQHLIGKVKPKVIIEVGTFLGASALHMAELTRQLGLHGTLILCIDDFRGWPGFHQGLRDMKIVNGDVLLMYQFMQNVVSHNATGLVLPVPFSSGSALQWLCEWGVYGDLIEVDAGHDFLSAWADINRAYQILRPGGVIFGHDYFTAADNRGVRRAVNLFAEMNGLKVQTDGQHWVIETSLPS